MKILCNNCDLYNHIEQHRAVLNNLTRDENYKLLNKEVIYLSELLDELICKCIFCSIKLNDSPQMDLKNIFGTHSTFYYYGEQHLFTGMYSYIREGIINNELIYISMQEKLYDKLIEFLFINDIPIEHIRFRPVKELIDSNKYGGLNGLKQKIHCIYSENEVKKYKGIRWIGQPTYAIETTSQDDFLNWEVNLSESLKNTNASLICIYDAYDYMHECKHINQTVIKKSFKTHTYVLNNSVLKKIL